MNQDELEWKVFREDMAFINLCNLSPSMIVRSRSCFPDLSDILNGYQGRYENLRGSQRHAGADRR